MVFFHWDPTINIFAIIATFSLLGTLTAFSFTLIQIRQNTRIQRARFLLDTIDLFFRDEQVQRAFAEIDSDGFTFNENTSASPDMIAMDRLLYTLDVFGFLVLSRTITIHDATILSFRVLRVMEHPQVRAYLIYLDRLFADQGAVLPSHQDARWLAARFRQGLPKKRKK